MCGLRLAEELRDQDRAHEPKLKADDVRIAQSAFEPAFTADYLLRDVTEESASVFFPGNQRSRSMGFDAGILGKLVTGTTYRFDFLNDRERTNSDITALNPSYTSEPLITLTQPLLRGFGVAVNRAEIIIARNNERQSIETFRAAAIDAVSDAKNAYYAYAYAIEARQIARDFLASARELVEINRARYAKGIASSVDLLEAEAAEAEREKLLLDAEYGLKTAEDKLKFVTNLVDDPETWNAEIELIEKPDFSVRSVDLVQSILDAFEHRPDYRARKIEVKNKDIRIVTAKNALLPTLDVVGSFGLNGLGDQYGRAVESIHWRYKDWGVGGSLRVPWGKGGPGPLCTSRSSTRRSCSSNSAEQRTPRCADKVREVGLQYRKAGSQVARDRRRETNRAKIASRPGRSARTTCSTTSIGTRRRNSISKSRSSTTTARS